MSASIRYLSVCSGIEAASAAWMPLGWRPVAFSEIESFPASVLAHHHPGVPNWGDMTKYEEWPDEPIDLLCGGTPCQSFSVAGLRKGLADPRGNLMLTFGAVAAKYRPRWLVWENVPGVLSSNGGRDFGAFLGLLAELGYGFAYRVLDAQYIRVESHPRAVPQRRRRVFVVGHSGGQWQRAAAVLFERESLCGHPAPRREAGETTPPGASDGAGVCSAVGCGRPSEKRGWCNSHCGEVAHALRGEGFDAGEDGTGRGTPLVAATLNAAMGKGKNGQDVGALVPAIVGQAMSAKWAKGSAGPAGDEHHNLIPVPFDTTQITSPSNYSAPRAGDACHPLAAGAHAPCIAFPARMSATQCASSENVAPSLGALNPTAVATQWAVRRLTPLECERLMGFPSAITKVSISLCIALQNNCVHAEAKCLRSQSNAQPADENELMRNASTAALHSSTRQVDLEPLVALRVQLRSGEPEAQISSRGKLIWSASGAGGQKGFHHPTLTADIALSIARQTLDLATETINGKGESLLSATLSLADASGNICAHRSTDVIEDFVCAAASVQLAERFTTSSLGRLTPTCDSKLATLLCSALVATSGFIPNETLNGSFSVEIEVESGHTGAPHKGKPAADGPRYRALGNSWAVNCARWIGERIASVDCIAAGDAA